MPEDIMTQEQIVAVFEEFKKGVDAIVEAVNRLAEAIKTAWNAMISTYANKRVQYLALHAKKHRVRKKNLHRMHKDFIRLLKYP